MRTLFLMALPFSVGRNLMRTAKAILCRSGAVVALVLAIPAISIAAPNTGGGGGGVHDCAGVERTCGGWAPKGNNTCRTCQQAQCKTENGNEVIAGNKTQTECYEGHGSPPSIVAPPKKLPKRPAVPNEKLPRSQ